MLNTSRSFAHLCLSLAFITCASGVMAQVSGQFGVKGGVSFTNMRGQADAASRTDWRTGFNAGVFGRIAAGQHLGAQAELLYSTNGSTVTYDGLNNQKTMFKLDYLELPVFAVIAIGHVVEVHAGAYAGYLLASKVNSESDLGSDGSALDRADLHNEDYGLVLGVSANLGRVQLGVQHLHGLAQLAQSNNAQVLLGNAHNSIFQVYVAVALNKM